MAEGIHLPTAAGTLVGLAGAMHVAVGVDALATEVTPLALLLVLWGAVALAGVVATAAGLLPRRVAYGGGLVLLAVSLLGYVDVYALGLSESALGVEWQPPESTHDHGSGHHDDGGGHHGGGDHHGGTADGHHGGSGGHDGTEASFAERLASGHFALPSKVVELVALGLLAVLLARE